MRKGELIAWLTLYARTRRQNVGRPVIVTALQKAAGGVRPSLARRRSTNGRWQKGDFFIHKCEYCESNNSSRKTYSLQQCFQFAENGGREKSRS